MTDGQYPNGFTIGIYLPKEATKQQVDRMIEVVSEAVYGGLSDDRGPWDPFMVGHVGDILQIDHEGHDCCPQHIYFSTGCFHGDHNYCQSERGLIGNKTPAVCKFCEAPCVCKCHGRTIQGEVVDSRIDSLSTSEGEGSREIIP